MKKSEEFDKEDLTKRVHFKGDSFRPQSIIDGDRFEEKFIPVGHTSMIEYLPDNYVQEKFIPIGHYSDLMQPNVLPNMIFNQHILKQSQPLLNQS